MMKSKEVTDVVVEMGGLEKTGISLYIKQRRTAGGYLQRENERTFFLITDGSTHTTTPHQGCDAGLRSAFAFLLVVVDGQDEKKLTEKMNKINEEVNAVLDEIVVSVHVFFNDHLGIVEYEGHRDGYTQIQIKLHHSDGLDTKQHSNHHGHANAGQDSSQIQVGSSTCQESAQGETYEDAAGGSKCGDDEGWVEDHHKFQQGCHVAAH